MVKKQKKILINIDYITNGFNIIIFRYAACKRAPANILMLLKDDKAERLKKSYEIYSFQF